MGLQFLILLAVALAGCGRSALKTADFSRLPTRSATPDELVVALNRDSASIEALKGKLEMGIQRAPDDAKRSCSGMLLAANEPKGSLYLKGYKRLLPTFFTLVSDGNEFWFHVPRDDLVYTGSVDLSWTCEDSLEFCLSANDLTRALFVQPVDRTHSFAVQDEGSTYVLTVSSGEAVQRKLWVERKQFQVVREIHYGTDGMEQLEILRSNYVALEGSLYPASLVLHDLGSGGRVYLDFSGIELGSENIPESAFDFHMPNGVEIKRVEENRKRT